MDDPSSLSLLFFAETAPSQESFNSVSVLMNALLVLLLVLGNGFFVASEFAIVAVRKSRIQSLANEGSKSAIRLLELLDNLTAYISATQLGVTLFSLGLGWVGEPAVAMVIEPFFHWLAGSSGASLLASGAIVHTVSFIVAFSVITFLHIVLGELAPKTVALELSERVALATALPMRIFFKTFYYPIRLLNWSGAMTVRIFGLRTSGEKGSIYSEEEIRHLIDVSKSSGHLNEEEQKLIHQVFEFSETTVREAMVPRTEIFAIPVTYGLNEIAEAFRESGFSRFPVYRDSLDDVAGVVHSKDVMSYLLNPEAFRIEKILRRPVYVVDTARLEDVLRRMQREQFHFGFVVDEHGGVEGIITLEDLLEEIVGEIADEYDEETAEQIHEQKDGTYILDGGLAVRDLNRKLGLNVPVSEGYTTIAGFLMAEAGQVLEKGESVPFNGHVFHVEEVERRRITKVKMEKVG
jgi:CBS domain containing-hemolysin-like protein